jgi:hypothetical protein
MTLFIIIFNEILMELTAALIKWIGYETHTEQMTATTNGVFGVIFFNTALVPLLANSFLTPYGY